MPARRSIAAGGFPIGLAHQIKVTKPIAGGEGVKWSDVAYDSHDETVKFRLEMEAAFKREGSA